MILRILMLAAFAATLHADVHDSVRGVIARKRAQFVDLPTLPDPADAIFWYGFEANSGTGDTVSDESGNGQHGTRVSAPPWVSGLVGTYAMDFDGAADYVMRDPASSAIADTGDVTVGAFIDLDAYPTGGNFRCILTSGGNGEDEPTNVTWQLRVTPTGAIQMMWETGAGTDVVAAASTGTVSLNTPTFVAAVRTTGGASTVTYYINGVAAGVSTGNTNATGGGTTRLTIGRRQGNADYFDGIIDHPFAFDEAYGVAAIGWLYNSGSGRAWSEVDAL